MNDLDLQHSTATVIALAEHFATLKGRVGELKEAIDAVDRGFFTPTEDEQTRHLLVSYSQSRNALIELVLSLYEHERARRQPRPAAMAIAYAGALVLIDAAMFLREHFHDRPIVRAKLNEPEPNFGIPKGTYDKVQKSLTSPRHVWHLYHAVRYIETAWPQLQELSQSNPQLQQVLALVEQLQSRLNVGRREYLWTRTRVRTRQIRTRIERDLIGKALYGLQKCVSRLLSEKYTRSGHAPSLPRSVEHQFETELRAGDIIVTRKEHALTNYFLPGYWPHVALYLGTLDELRKMRLDEHEHVKPRWDTLLACDAHRDGRVLEALKDGVRLRSLATPLKSDAVALVRPRLSSTEISEALGRGVFHAGKPYDFDFDFTRSDRMVCTEVVYRSYDGVGGLAFDLVKRAGRMTISAEDILGRALANDGFEVHAVYTPSDTPDGVKLGVDAARIVESTLRSGDV